jgi:imidazole glycerol-phosphate synthase subunit HisH
VPAAPDVVVASTEYGLDFAAVLWRDNLYATQFHPEKSQTHGLRLLRNFALLSQEKR